MKKLKKETNDAPIKGIRNIFRPKKKINQLLEYIRDIRDIRNLFEHEEEDYKPVRVGNFWSNNYIKYKSKGDRKTVSVKKYLNRIRPYLKDINNLKKN